MRIIGLESREEGGFTIVEVIIAAILLAIIVTGIAFFFMHMIKLSDRMDDQTRAWRSAGRASRCFVPKTSSPCPTAGSRR